VTNTADLLIPAVIAFLTGSSFVTIIGYFFLRPKTKAEAAKARSEADAIDVRTQIEINNNLRQQIAEQTKRIEDLEERVDTADRREHIVAIFVYEASNWMRRASDTMEPHQRELVGDPPKADPELFVGLSFGKQSSRPQSVDGSDAGITS
jgi:hypothetical protein